MKFEMKFEIRRTRNKQFRAYIVASNGRILFWSETYKRRAGALWAAQSVRKQASWNTVLVDRTMPK